LQPKARKCRVEMKDQRALIGHQKKPGSGDIKLAEFSKCLKIRQFIYKRQIFKTILVLTSHVFPNSKCPTTVSRSCSELNYDNTVTNDKLRELHSIECKTIELPKDNIGENLNDLGYGDSFLCTTPKT